MSAPSATIELYIDDVLVPSTPQDLYAGKVTALTDLRLTWGRDGQNEQPGPASCSFQLLDPAGNDTALDVLHVGSDIDVWAQGEIDTGGDQWGPTIMDNGSFTGWADGPPPPRSTTSNQNSVITVVAETLKIEPGRQRSYYGVIVPPRQLSPIDTLPNAWDDIPRSVAEQRWRVQARVKAPVGVRVTLGSVLYSAPYAGSATTSFGDANHTGTGDWVTVQYQAWPPAGSAGGWYGFTLISDYLGPRLWQGQTGTWAEDTRTWDDPSLLVAAYVDDISIQPPASTTRRVLVFSGEVSDVKIAPYGNRVSTLATVTAMDEGARLENTVIGDEPWPVQTVSTRANRIAQLAGVTTLPRVRIDTPLGALQVSARDVDAQPSYALLQDLAQSAGGVLWAATHAVTGPFLWIENPANRAAVRQLVEDGGVITITGATDDVTMMSACDLLEEPVEWLQDTADVITVVAVTWAEQGVDDDGQPTVTDRTVTVTDTAAVATYGTRRLSVSTELVNESDATTMANRLLAQARAVAWRLSGLVLDTAANLDDSIDSLDDATREVALLDLLDGTTRMGRPVTLVDMPDYAPRGAISSVYVEGGTYSYTDDAWRLALTTTPSAGQGDSVTWAQLSTTQPAWTWAQFADIAWQDLYGTTV